MKLLRFFLIISVFLFSFQFVAFADESCFTVPKLEMVAIANGLNNEISNFEEVQPEVIAQKVSERAGVNCSVEDLMSIFSGDNTVAEECVQLEEFEDRFWVLSMEESILIEYRDKASSAASYVNGMFNEIAEIGQASFFAEEGNFNGNDALFYTAEVRGSVWDIETNRRGVINELLTELNNCSSQEYLDNGLDVEFGRLLSGIQNFSILLEETHRYVIEIAALEGFIISSFNAIGSETSAEACRLFDSYNSAVSAYNAWVDEELPTSSEADTYFNTNVQPSLNAYLEFATVCER